MKVSRLASNQENSGFDPRLPLVIDEHEEPEPIYKAHKGISYEIEIEFLPGSVVKYTAIPAVKDIDPGIRTVLAFQYTDKPDEEDVDEPTMDFIHELTLERVFGAIEVAKEKNLLGWLGL